METTHTPFANHVPGETGGFPYLCISMLLYPRGNWPLNTGLRNGVFSQDLLPETWQKMEKSSVGASSFSGPCFGPLRALCFFKCHWKIAYLSLSISLSLSLFAYIKILSMYTYIYIYNHIHLLLLVKCIISYPRRYAIKCPHPTSSPNSRGSWGRYSFLFRWSWHPSAWQPPVATSTSAGNVPGAVTQLRCC